MGRQLDVHRRPAAFPVQAGLGGADDGTTDACRVATQKNGRAACFRLTAAIPVVHPPGCVRNIGNRTPACRIPDRSIVFLLKPSLHRRVTTATRKETIMATQARVATDETDIRNSL